MQNKDDFVVNISELVPQEAEFQLSSTNELVHVLKPYTLGVQLWAAKKFGSEILEKALNTRDAEVLSELAWHVLRDKSVFSNSFENFLDSVVTFQDRSNLLTAIFQTVGMSQPVLENIAKQIEDKNKAGNENSPEQTGHSSTTKSPAPTPPTRKSKRS
jgi:hypothetical protein